ncbi:hypothetical protein COU01_01875 [Candidatus Falkowbacteria bacterium CG10_big_fil_rev_8_21_14_0_10_44_15]|uniref:O-antigen ligase-related domain-containing protein n=1 Tax=Candidatus Falkowbacteria bacterium CG10_big_fil_rev_8_21_14_0_10_44_15 TaxID=1974569 RepID=A0A2H0UZZ8_9BACT|nr:MAG: hypothetical protein COU01_01875 [Candidatus Falkowbacteria bacterium CG10_big_fil_rev_8_21_14_0_10_44_15]
MGVWAKQKIEFIKKSQEYLLYILIFLLPLQTRWMAKLGELNGGYWEYGTYSLYFTDVLVLLLLCLLAALAIVNHKFSIFNFQFSKIWIIIGILELVIFISALAAPDKSLALYGYGRFLLGAGLFFLLTQISYDKIKLYWGVVAAGAAQSILALQQFMTQAVWGNKWLGMAAQEAKNLGVSVVEFGDERWLRAYGSLPHPNILGGFLAVTLLVNIILYFTLWQNWQTAENIKQDKKYKTGLILSLIFFILNLVGLLLTFSRSAWLGFAVGALTLTLFPIFSGRGKQDLKVFSKFVFIIIAVGGLFFYFFREPILSRINIDGRLENKSVAERTEYNQEARQIINKHWLFGAGVKNYGLAVYNEISNHKPAYAYQPAHNAFLLIWAEIGVLGLISFLVFLFSCFFMLWRRKNFEIMAVLAAMVAMMPFDHWWWSLAFGGMIMWVVLGIVYADRKVVIKN